jgi:hypothetical protein
MEFGKTHNTFPTTSASARIRPLEQRGDRYGLQRMCEGEHSFHHNDNLRACCAEPGLSGCSDLIRVYAYPGQHGCRVGWLIGQPGHRVGRQLVNEVPRSIHSFDPLSARWPRLERIAEVLRLVDHLATLEFHDADDVIRLLVIGHDKFANP